MSDSRQTAVSNCEDLSAERPTVATRLHLEPLTHAVTKLTHLKLLEREAHELSTVLLREGVVIIVLVLVRLREKE